MNRTINPTILAIDLGKFKCVACSLDQDTGEFRFAITPATKVFVTYSQQVETPQQANQPGHPK